MGESLLVLNSQLRVVSANQDFYQIFHVKHEETENRSLYELGQGQWNIPRLRELLERVVREKNEIYNFILLTHHPLQQFAQPGNIPLALAKFIERSVFCFFMLNVKYLVKILIGGDHT